MINYDVFPLEQLLNDGCNYFKLFVCQQGQISLFGIQIGIKLLTITHAVYIICVFPLNEGVLTFWILVMTG